MDPVTIAAVVVGVLVGIIAALRRCIAADLEWVRLGVAEHYRPGTAEARVQSELLAAIQRDTLQLL